MITDHTVILGATTIGISTAVHRNRNPAHNIRRFVTFSRYHYRFSKRSAAIASPLSHQTSRNSNMSVQAVNNRRSIYLHANLSDIATSAQWSAQSRLLRASSSALQVVYTHHNIALTSALRSPQQV